MKKKFRLLKNRDFQSTIGNKKAIQNRCYIFYFRANKLDHCRIGLSVGKKIGNAVVRNRIRRQIRPVIVNEFPFEESVDLVIIVKQQYLSNEQLDNIKLLSELIKKYRRNKNGK